jgi:hypothetical protein
VPDPCGGPRSGRAGVGVLGAFWDGVAGSLAGRWSSIGGPALVFWAGVGLVWAAGHGGWGAIGRQLGRLDGQKAGTQVAVLAAGLVVVAASALLVSRMTLPVLRLIEGYWPRPLSRLRELAVRRREARIEAWEAEWQSLATRLDGPDASRPDAQLFVRLDERLHYVPGRASRRTPTRVGDALSAAEGTAFDRYGLDALKCWPALWAVLPEQHRADLVAARQAVDTTVAAMIWAGVFCFTAVWVWWTPLLGLAVLLMTYFVWLPQRVQTYADLIVATFDVHRVALYEALRWPQPARPVDERACGLAVTDFLWTGNTSSTVRYSSEPTNDR